MNITNVHETTITSVVVNNVTVNNYRNAPAATVVRSDAFARGAPVQRALAPVPVAEIALATPLAASGRTADFAHLDAKRGRTPTGGNAPETDRT